MLSFPVIFPCGFCNLLSSNRTEKRFSPQMPATQVLKDDQQQGFNSVTKSRFHLQRPCPPQSGLIICTNWAGLAVHRFNYNDTVPKQIVFCTVLMDSATHCNGTVHSRHSPTVDSDANSTVSEKMSWHKVSEVLATCLNSVRKKFLLLIPIFVLHCQFSF